MLSTSAKLIRQKKVIKMSSQSQIWDRDDSIFGLLSQNNIHVVK